MIEQVDLEQSQDGGLALGFAFMSVRLAVTLGALLAMPLSASAATSEGAHGAVATDQKLASQIGLRVLQTGGNAVDAAVAIGYALAVAYPSAGNIGGGGFMLLRSNGGGAHFIDFRETAPAAATEKMYQDAAGHIVAERSTVGALAVGVPGTVAELEFARTHYGTRSLHDVLAPAIALAANGFPLSEADARVLSDGTPLLARFAASAGIFTRAGTALSAGDVLRQPALAATLRALDRHGADEFYHGVVAKRLAAAIAAAGGIITTEDLGRYRAVERTPLECVHRGHRILAAPPPSSGGIVLCETLGIMGEGSVGAFRSVADAHLEIESERRAFADRGALGDPDFVRAPIEQLLGPEHLSRERASISTTRATPSAQLQSTAVHEGTNTTNYSVVDAAGNAVDVTYTLNSSFGSGLVAGDTGVLLNNEMDDFASAPGVPNQFGLVQGSANAIAPGKRPLSSMLPTIVSDPSGRVVLVAGAAGGPRIITTILGILRNVVDFATSIGVAMDAPRVHEQWLPDVVTAEAQAFDGATLHALQAMGHRVEIGAAGSAANAIVVRPDGTRVAAHDDRRPTGNALAY